MHALKQQTLLRWIVYSGMSFKMVVPQFHIRLSSPSSTSMHKEVAQRFAGSNGIIMMFNNDGDQWSKFLRCFDVSWLSRYPEEDERFEMYCLSLAATSFCV